MLIDLNQVYPTLFYWVAIDEKFTTMSVVTLFGKSLRSALKHKNPIVDLV